MMAHVTTRSSDGESGDLRLGFGRFLGRVLAAADGPSIAVREVAARAAHPGVPRHTHDDAHFCLVVSGTVETATHNLRGRCGTSTLLFHPAGTTHEDQFLSPDGRCLMVSLEPSLIERLGAPSSLERSIALDDARIGFPGSRMRRELREPGGCSQISMENLTLEMVGAVLARAERSAARRPAWLPRAVEFLRDGATDPVRVADVAQAVGVHPVHLARVFRRHLGLSPGEYLRRVRVHAAMERIERTADSLALIAFQSGFCDQSELTKAFRREMGTTPAAFRHAVRR